MIIIEILYFIIILLTEILVEVDQGDGISLLEDQDRHSYRPLAEDVFDFIAI